MLDFCPTGAFAATPDRVIGSFTAAKIQASRKGPVSPAGPGGTLDPVGTAAQLVAGAVLLWAAASKVRLRGDLPDLLGAYGVPRSLRAPAAYALILSEALVGAALLFRLAPEAASLAALALGALFVAAPATALARGVRRIRCGCFGADERPTVFVLARGAGFAALAALAVWGDGLEGVDRDALVLAALAVLAAAVVALALLVLALYRQVGVLTLRLGPRAALEVPEEGPPVGRPAPPLAGLERLGGLPPLPRARALGAGARAGRPGRPARRRGRGAEGLRALERARDAVRRPPGRRRRRGEGPRELARTARRPDRGRHGEEGACGGLTPRSTTPPAPSRRGSRPA
jgi:hypothetical protein